MLTRLDAKGQSFSYSYDALNRLTTLDAPGTADDISYTYDSCTNGLGRLCSVAIGDGLGSNTVSYGYDALGNVICASGHQLWLRHRRACSNHHLSLRQCVIYTYDAAGQVSQVDLNRPRSPISASAIIYAPFGPVTDLTYGNGHSLSQGVDTAYRFTDHTVTGAWN